MTRGTVISYDPDEDTGFIDPDDGDERIPFDRKSLHGYERGTFPQKGDRVFLVVEGGMAGFYATNVSRLTE